YRGSEDTSAWQAYGQALIGPLFDCSSWGRKMRRMAGSVTHVSGIRCYLSEEALRVSWSALSQHEIRAYEGNGIDEKVEGLRESAFLGRHAHESGADALSERGDGHDRHPGADSDRAPHACGSLLSPPDRPACQARVPLASPGAAFTDSALRCAS